MITSPRDVPQRVLVEIARRKRDRALAADPNATRFRFCEANHLAQLDAVVDWLERVPLSEWTDEYLERRHR